MTQLLDNKEQKKLRPVGKNILVELRPSASGVDLGVVISNVNPPCDDFSIEDTIGFSLTHNTPILKFNKKDGGTQVLINQEDVLFVLDDVSIEKTDRDFSFL